MQVEEQFKDIGLRRIPIGEKDNIFNYLKQFTANQWKLYLVLQDMSNWNSSCKEKHRYIDYTQIPLDDIYKRAGLSKPTGISCLKKLEDEGWIVIEKTNHEYYGAIKYIKIPNTIGSIFVKCNLNLDLYKILQSACKPIVVKIYLYHCFMGSKHKKDNYIYKQPLINIARVVGASLTNLQPIIDAHKLLEEIGVLKIKKVWKGVEGDLNHCENIYTFNPQYRTKEQLKREKEKKKISA